jgi:hypothetical protein
VVYQVASWFVALLRTVLLPWLAGAIVTLLYVEVNPLAGLIVEVFSSECIGGNAFLQTEVGGLFLLAYVLGAAEAVPETLACVLAGLIVHSLLSKPTRRLVLVCGHCGESLKGLYGPVCPECGKASVIAKRWKRSVPKDAAGGGLRFGFKRLLLRWIVPVTLTVGLSAMYHACAWYYVWLIFTPFGDESFMTADAAQIAYLLAGILVFSGACVAIAIFLRWLLCPNRASSLTSCTYCGYQLVGLASPKCPFCGRISTIEL